MNAFKRSLRCGGGWERTAKAGVLVSLEVAYVAFDLRFLSPTLVCLCFWQSCTGKTHSVKNKTLLKEKTYSIPTDEVSFTFKLLCTELTSVGEGVGGGGSLNIYTQ